MQPFPKRMTVLRQIDISSLNVVSLNTTPITGIPAQLYRPVESTITQAREAPSPYNLRYRLRAFGSLLLRYRSQSMGVVYPRLQPGDRVRLDGTDYEALSNARSLSHGQRLVSYEVSIAGISELYPLTAQLKDNESVIDAAVPIALTPVGGDIHTDRGTYQDFDGEAPVEYAPTLIAGRTLVLGSVRYRIRSSELSLGVVRFSVRRAGG